MSFAYLVPNWFFGLDIIMELLFFLVTIAIAISALKIYNLTKQENIRKFSIGFILISLSYLVWAGLNAITIPNAASHLPQISIQQISFISFIVNYSQMMLFIAGLVMLAYTTFNINKGGVFYLLLGLSLMILVVSVEKVITFRIVSVFLLSFIAYHYLLEYKENSNKNTFLVLTGFSLLLISNLELLLTPVFSLSYVVSHLIELVAYSLFLITLIRTLRKS